MLKYAGPGMVDEDVELAEYVDNVIMDVFDRMKKNPLIIAFPQMFMYQITEADKRYYKNCGTLRGFIREAIKERQN